MKKPISRIISAAVCVALLVGVVGGVYAIKGNTTVVVKQESSTVDIAPPSEDGNLTKDETVYVLANADGSVKKVIVSDWIKNTLGSTSIPDKSELTDVKNVKGDESYTLGGDNARVWDAEGNDIYYQGNITKELPVNMAVTYTLDGKTVSPKELAGKSGKVTIRYDYTNNQYEYVNIDGKQEKIYVPFVMLSGMLLNNDVFTNVEVTNGKIINDGDKTAVIGVALPGLQNNLNITDDKFEIPDYIEISADVKKFALSTTVTVATNEMFNAIDTSNFDSVDSLTSSVNELSDAMKQLMDGSSKLYNGLDLLLGKSDDLINGVDKLAAGLNTLDSKSGELTAGSKQVFNTFIEQANTTFAENGLPITLTIDNYDATLSGIIANPAYAANLAIETRLAKMQIPSAYYGAVKYMLYQQLSSGKTLDEAMTYLTAAMQSPAAQTALQQAAMAAATDAGKAAINGMCANIGNSYLPAIRDAYSKLNEYNAFYNGLAAYTDGVKQAVAGANELKSNLPALKSGITELRDGSVTLSSGLKEFNEKGIQKLVDAVNGNVSGLITRLKATVDVAKDYKSFSGISDDMDGQVKFIYRTDSVK